MPFRPGRLRRVAGWCAVVLASAALQVPGTARADVVPLAPVPQALTATQQVSADPFSGGGAQHATEVEPDVAAWGSTIVGVFQVGRYNAGGSAMAMGWARSGDGGATWTSGLLPGLTTSTNGSWPRTADPSVAYDSVHRTWLATGLGIGLVNKSYDELALLLNRSSDGMTWSRPSTIASTGEPDKDWLACDNGASSPRAGTCYAVWSSGATNDQYRVSTTVDGGLTWSTPVGTLLGAQGYAVQPVVEPDGTLVVVAEDSSGSSVVAFRSTDGGATLSEPLPVSTISSHAPAQFRGSVKPSAAVAPDGTVSAVWYDCRFRAGCAANDVVRSTSGDGGLTWTPVTRIGPDDPAGTVDHFLPAVGIDPASPAGAASVAVVYLSYPVAACGSAGQPACHLQEQMVTSTDGGATWGAPVTVTRAPQSPGWLPVAYTGHFVGDYVGLTWSRGAAVTLLPMSTAKSGTLYNQAMNAAVIGPDTVGPADATVREPGPGGGPTYAVVPVQLASPQPRDVSVDYATVDGTATAGSGDYTATSGTAVIPAGSTTVGVRVPVLADGTVEGTETFGVRLTSPSGATLSRGSATVTVLDGDLPPAISVSDPSVIRGSDPSSGPAAVFTVSLDRPSPLPVSVGVATTDGTAAAGRDYTAVSKTLTFPPGQRTTTVSVPTFGAAGAVPTETFGLQLSAPVNASLADPAGTAALVPAVGPPQVFVDDSSVVEGNSGTTPMTFTVRLVAPAAVPVTVSYATAGGTATSGTDVQATSGTVVIPAGSLSAPVDVPVIGDTISEQAERFTLSITASAAFVIDPKATGTIRDDDGHSQAAPPPAIGVSDAYVVRGTDPSSGPTASFTLSLSRTSPSPVTVTVHTVDGGAVAGQDYVALPPTQVTIPAGATTATVGVSTRGAPGPRARDSFTLVLSAPVHAVLEDTSASGVLLPDAGPPSLAVDDAVIAEDGGALTFPVRLAAPTAVPVTVHYATTGGSATAGSDYTPVSGTLTIAAGSSSGAVTVPVIDDAVRESNETVTLTLSKPTAGAALADASGKGTIVDDD